MKPLIKRSKVFFEHRTIRTAISVAVVVSCSVGLLTVYYLRNSTYDYSQSLTINRSLTNGHGGFENEKAYVDSLNADNLSQSYEKYLFMAHGFAADILKNPEPAKIRTFVRVVSTAKPSKEATDASEQVYDSYAEDMLSVVEKLVDYSNTLSLPDQFEEKRQTLLTASKIATTLDCRYSFSAYMARIHSNQLILGELHALQASSSPQELKSAIIDSCFSELRKPLRTAQMLRKEQLRILGSFDITLNTAVAGKKSINYRKPEEFPVWVKWVQKLPNVENALRSRVFETFNDAYRHYDKAKDVNECFRSGIDGATLARLVQNVEQNRASVDLIVQFAPEMLNTRNRNDLKRMQADLRNLVKQTIE